MGKDKPGFLSPKVISNGIKAKGLQKLRWYCQMCQKQCRDEKGFKCHTTSESHQRQLFLVADNPGEFVDTFSKEFLETFIEILKRRFGTKRVLGNVVYQEYIADRHQKHMNATQWSSLIQFFKCVGRQGYCVVDKTKEGWFIRYTDKTPGAIKKQAQEKKSKMEFGDEDRRNKIIQQQIERDKMRKDTDGGREDNDKEKVGGDNGDDGVKYTSNHKPTELMRACNDDKMVFKIDRMSKCSTRNAKRKLSNEIMMYSKKAKKDG